MQTPEELAREIRRLTWDVLGNDGLVEEDGPALADLIRARDAKVAEVSAKAAAKVLREAVADLDRRTGDPALIEAADRDAYYAGVRAAMQRESQLLLDRIEREGEADE